MADSDLYQTLGVAKTATSDEIRKAYRKLARKHHPDVNPGNATAAEQFKKIAAAYEVLGDEKKRKAFDEFGDESLRSGFDPEKAREYERQARTYEQQARSYGRGGGAGGGDEAADFGGFDFDLEDLLGGGGRRRGGRGGPIPGEDVLARVELDLATALVGTELSVDAPSGQTCSTCHGAGNLGQTCDTCKGSGRVSASQGPMRFAQACPTCHGTGKQPCATCHGEGVLPGTRKVTVRIPPGADQGSRLRVAGLGTPGRGGGEAGDLWIEVHVKPHAFFRRDGLDLYLKLPITVAEAYLGASVAVPTPDGSVQLKVPPRSQTGQTLRLRGKGVKKGQETGNLLVELAVRLPDGEDAAFGEAARAADAAYTTPVREGVTL